MKKSMSYSCPVGFVRTNGCNLVFGRKIIKAVLRLKVSKSLRLPILLDKRKYNVRIFSNLNL